MFARWIDNVHGVARYFLNFFIISFGIISSMDFSSLKKTYPHWERQIYLISHNASYIVLIAASFLLASEIFHHIFCKKSIKALNRELDKLTQQNSIISENIDAIFNRFLI